jgi:aspartate aminotransferase-like enzyme
VARDNFGVQLAGGQASLEATIFRIGHLGYVTPNDVIQALAAIEMALARAGHPVDLGAGVKAAMQIWLENA